MPSQFLATIYKIWMLRYVDVPEDIGLALAKEYAAARAKQKSNLKSKRTAAKSLPKHIPVVATSGHRTTRTTMVPASAGRYPACEAEFKAFMALAKLAKQAGDNWHIYEPALEALQDQILDCVDDNYPDPLPI